jgi:hypothetical protein
MAYSQYDEEVAENIHGLLQEISVDVPHIEAIAVTYVHETKGIYTRLCYREGTRFVLLGAITLLATDMQGLVRNGK